MLYHEPARRKCAGPPPVPSTWAASSQLSLLSLPRSRSRHRGHLGTPTFSPSDPGSLVSPKQDSASSHSPDLILHWSPEPAFQSNVPWGSLPAWSATHFPAPWASRARSARWHCGPPKGHHPPQDTADYSSPVPPLGPTGPSPLSAVALTPHARGPFVAVPHPASRAPGEPATALRCQLTLVGTEELREGTWWAAWGSLGLSILGKTIPKAKNLCPGDSQRAGMWPGQASQLLRAFCCLCGKAAEGGPRSHPTESPETGAMSFSISSPPLPPQVAEET